MAADTNDAVAAAAKPSRLRAMLDSDIVYSFLRSNVTIAAAIVTLIIVLAALLAPVDRAAGPLRPAPAQPARLAQSAGLAAAAATARFLLGTDDQGRDVFSTILYGSRQSIAIGVMATVFAAILGIALGLIAGYAGGAVDAFIMRAADIQATFPAILIAMLVDGTSRALFGEQRNEQVVFWVMVLSIGLSFWVQYARTVRGSTLVEKSKDYVLAARLIGIHPALILFRHVLPNVVGPGAGDRHHQSRARDHHRGDAVVPRARPALDPALARHADPDRAEIPVRRRMVDRDLPRHHARRAGAGGEPARRLAARRAQSATALTCACADAPQYLTTTPP